MRRRTALIALLAAVLVGCLSDDPAPVGPRFPDLVEPAYDAAGRILPDRLAEQQVLHRGNGTQPQTLDPHRVEGIPASRIVRDLFEGLVTLAPDGAIVPGQAESWTVSDDGRVYTFRLREGLVWSNGDPLDARDFVYGFRRALDPATGSRFGHLLYAIENAEAVVNGELPPERLAVQAPDPRTVEIRLIAPTPIFIRRVAHTMAMPVHRASVETHGDAWARPDTMVSNGAFVLSELKVQQHIRIDRNPRFRDAASVILDTVYFHPIEDQSTELSRFRAGELDWTEGVPNNQFRWIQQNMADELTVAPYLGIYYFGFNVTRPPFEDQPALRKALSLAIDRDIITGKITQFGERPAYAFVPPGIDSYPAYEHPWAALSQQQRLDLARRYYREAGYSEDQPLEVEIRYNTSENHKRVAVAIQAMWRYNLGVKATLVNEEWKVFLQNRNQKQVTEVFRAGWIGDADATSFLEILLGDSGMNDTGYASARFDELMGRAAVEIDATARRDLLRRAEVLMLEDHPVMPIYSYVSKRLVAPYVGGWQPNVVDTHSSRYLYILKHRPDEQR
jgi:oligopeptide transport system substrate-binding protein